MIRLRTMESDESISLTSGTRTIALPSGFIEPIALYLNRSGSARDDLTGYYVTPSRLSVNTQATAAREPTYWAINATNIEFECLADQTYSMTFRMLKSFALSDSSPTNWLLTNFPNAYLYGALLQTPQFTRNLDANLIGMWQRSYDRAIKQANRVAGRTKSAARLRTDIPVSRGGYNVLTDN